MQFNQLKIHPVISDNQTQRLNFIAGRYLSEQEFDLMQQYVDERCEDLLLTMPPGIVQGLEVIYRKEQPEFPIQVNPGVGVSCSGKAIGSRFPLRFYWPHLRTNYLAERGAGGKLEDGLYFLTLRRKVVIIDEDKQADPCVRTEADPLRDSRLETIAQVNLQKIPVASSLLSYSRQRASMRILKKMLRQDLFSQNPNELKLALVKIKDAELVWLDDKSARFMAQENSVYQAMLHYWHAILKAPTPFRLDAVNATFSVNTVLAVNSVLAIDSAKPTKAVKSTKPLKTLLSEKTLAPVKSIDSVNPIDPVDLQVTSSLNKILGLDFLPAAGKFPEKLIENIAGKQIFITKDDVIFNVWQRPILKFNPADLQIEIVPVPANAVNGVINAEINRGVVDLLNGEADRIRLMVAVDPDSYHPKLMDLPEIDKDLIVDLSQRRVAAHNAYEVWAKEFYKLYEKLDESADFESGSDVPTKKTLEIFSAVHLVNIPDEAFSKTKFDTPVKIKNLKLPAAIFPPEKVKIILDEIVANRIKRLPLNSITPRPYSLRGEIIDEAETVLINPKNNKDGLFQERIKVKQDIAEIENYILRTNQLIDEMRDYLSLQRQQLDSITTSFATLAGGISGDGTGLKLMRWADRLTFTTKSTTT